MQRCPACDHFNLVDATTCERCGQTLLSESDTTTSPSVGPSPETFEGRVLQTARTNGKIAAIKLYREQRGVGLKEAKDAVEAMMAEHGVTAGGAGCGAAVLAMFVVLMAAIGLLAT